jgi:hypothetical protein
MFKMFSADREAKKAAKLADISRSQEDCSWQSFRLQARKFVKRVWQRQWKMLDQQRSVHICYPEVQYGRLRTGLHKFASAARIRLLSGHSRLADHMYRIGLSSTPNCGCGTDRQTAEHLLIDCPDLNQQRMHMFDLIERAFINNKVPLQKRKITISTILAPNHDLKTNLEIHQAFSNFIGSCTYKI